MLVINIFSFSEKLQVNSVLDKERPFINNKVVNIKEK